MINSHKTIIIMKDNIHKNNTITMAMKIININKITEQNIIIIIMVMKLTLDTMMSMLNGNRVRLIINKIIMKMTTEDTVDLIWLIQIRMLHLNKKKLINKSFKAFIKAMKKIHNLQLLQELLILETLNSWEHQTLIIISNNNINPLMTSILVLIKKQLQVIPLLNSNLTKLIRIQILVQNNFKHTVKPNLIQLMIFLATQLHQQPHSKIVAKTSFNNIKFQPKLLHELLRKERRKILLLNMLTMQFQTLCLLTFKNKLDYLVIKQML